MKKKKKDFLIFSPAIILTIVLIVLNKYGVSVSWGALAPVWILDLALFIRRYKQ